jgi:hypothetical protein
MNREEFLGFKDVVIEAVAVKEMKTTLFVRSLSAAEKARWEMDPLSVDNNAKDGQRSVKFAKDRMVTARERLVEIATCNEDGSNFFKSGDAAQIGGKNANIISTLYDVAARLSGISKEDLEQVAKNSGTETEAADTLSV